MRAATQITEPLIRDCINRAVTDVFKSMVGREPVLAGEAPPQGKKSLSASALNRPQVVGKVGFVGEASGLIYLHLDLEFARVCTRLMLGMSDAELDEAGDEVINDAVGELTNMTVGGFKNGLGAAGHPCKFTIPSILRSTDFSIEPTSSGVRHIYTFECTEHRIVADILMKPNE
jgi:chemotaxis protein CheX